jgi:lysophospholipase L1-like esterase
MKFVSFFIVIVSFSCFAQKTTIFSIGDSTMADKVKPNENPEKGWCQVLPSFFDLNKVTIDNRAVNGRSTKSFIDEKRWESIYKALKPGDYVFIQFGHNDEKVADSSRYTNPHTAYRHNLIRFVTETREKGGIPILFSSIARRNFNDKAVLIGTHGEYPLEARLVAQEYQVPFVDLEYYTEVLEQSYGVEQSKQLHLHFLPGEHPYYPEGKEDNTHLSLKGATAVAEIALSKINLIQDSSLEVLKKAIKNKK